MQSEAKNKMINPDTATNVVAVSSIRNKYFFPGGGIWKPMNVEATNLAQAEDIHKQTREPIETPPSEAPDTAEPALEERAEPEVETESEPTEEKVDETKTNE